jgi:uncharacterized LabA/DUF88 family protein
MVWFFHDGSPFLRFAQPDSIRIGSENRRSTFNGNQDTFAKRCFGYKFPNFDIAKLIAAIVALEPNRKLVSSCFYIGIPTHLDDLDNFNWWNKKLAAMGRSGVKVERRYLKRRELKIRLEGIVYFEATIPRLQEKGIDLKLGLDLVRSARNNEFDAGIIFSQDGDLVEAVEEVHGIAREQKRWIQLECAHPVAAGVDSRPIKRTIPRQMTKALYDACLDATDYRK